MGKKKKTPPPKVYNTRSTSKEEPVVREQVASWWDKLISGNVESSEIAEKKDESSVKKSEEINGLSKFVSSVPTVSAFESSSGDIDRSMAVSSEKMVKSDSESSGSSFTVAGDESVNSSPYTMKKSGENSIKSSKFASVYEVLGYNDRNIPIPARPESLEKLTPLKAEAMIGKNEYEIWMMRSEQSKKSAGIFTSENLSGSSSRINDKFCGNDVTSAGNDGDCRKAAVKADNLKNPNNSCPLDDVTKGQMECSVEGPNHVATELGNIAKVGSVVDLDQINSPSGVSPGMFTNVNTSPIEEIEDPIQAADLPSAAATGSTNVGLQNDIGPVNDNNPTGVDKPAMNITNGPADKAKVQKKVSFSDMVKQGVPNLSPHVVKFGSFETCINFNDDIPDSDPIRGTKYWNKELFQRLLNGEGVVDGESRLAYDAPKRNEAGVFEVNIEGHFMTKSYASNIFQLYGYFIGANMPFRVVKENVIKMWHRYGLKSINVNRGGYFFFKFDHEEGMLQVLERNPWLIDNVPLVLQMWDPNVVLSKPNPKSVPVWVAIKDLPLSLWNGGNIGQVVSCVGRPLMLDQTTLKRCELKEGPLNFARVLVDASASNGLPDKVKINLPKCDGVPGKSYFLDLSYKWKPPCCSFCKVFGHVDDKCEFKKDKGPTLVLKNQRLSNDKLAVDVEKFRDDEFVDVVRKSKAQNKGKQPVWQVKKTNGGPVILEPGTSRQAGPNNMGSKDDMGQRKPSDKAAGLHKSADYGPSVVGCDELPPIKAVGMENVLSPLVDEINSAVKQFKKDGPNVTGPTVKPKGSGYFDVSKQTYGPGPSANISTKNSFGTLRDEEECFDTDLGLWEHEIEMVKKFVDSSTRPKIEEYSAWSENLRKYYDSLTKVDGEEAEVESDTGETAQFMKIGSKF